MKKLITYQKLTITLNFLPHFQFPCLYKKSSIYSSRQKTQNSCSHAAYLCVDRNTSHVVISVKQKNEIGKEEEVTIFL